MPLSPIELSDVAPRDARPLADGVHLRFVIGIVLYCGFWLLAYLFK